MTRKGKVWLHRILSLAVATVLAVQPVSALVSPMGVVYAAEKKELVENGDFSSGGTNWYANTEGEVSVSYDDGSALFNIPQIGNLDRKSVV